MSSDRDDDAGPGRKKATRRPHLIRYLGQRVQPNLAICVQASTNEEYGGDADEYGTTRIVLWHAESMELAASRPVMRLPHSGDCASSFWELLRVGIRGYSSVLLLSAGAREHMALFGLWDRVMSGDYRIAGYDPRAGKEREGYVVLESPPTIAAFSEKASNRLYTWMDPHNYGAKVGMDTLSPHCASPGILKDVACEVQTWLYNYLQMLKDLGLGTIEQTAASQAAQGFRLSYMDYDITTHDNEAVLAMERAALMGGRNECRFLGQVFAGERPPLEHLPAIIPNWQAGLFDGDHKPEPDAEDNIPRAILDKQGDLYQLDFNSLYPAVAKEAMLPVKLSGVLRNPSVATLLACCQTHPTIATVRVEIPVACVPVWVDRRYVLINGKTATRRAVSGKRDHLRMIFPTGDFNAVLCGPEIMLAHANGNIVSCGQAAVYEGRPLYRSWVSQLYAARLRYANGCRQATADSVKAIMCSSFAKWAQLRRRWVDVPNEMCPWPWDQWWRMNRETQELEQWRCFAWSVQRLETDGEPGDSFPAITAYINSLGRVKLWEAMVATYDAPIFYVDTDSLWTTAAGLSRLQDRGMVDPQELGKLKIVNRYDAAEFFGLKRYFADGKLTIAGADGETCRTSDAFALSMRAAPTHSYLRSHRPPGIDRHAARLRLALPYRHGMVEDDGTIEPWTIFDR